MSSITEANASDSTSMKDDPPSSEATLAHVSKVWTRILSASPVYAFFLQSATIIHASSGLLRARLVIGPHHINSKHTLHGSVSATLVDWAGGLVVATEGLEATGLSTDLNVTFVSVAREGEEIEIEACLLRLGRNMAFTRVEIRRATDGEVVACGNHTKYVKREQQSSQKE